MLSSSQETIKTTQHTSIAQSIALLDSWLQSLHQAGGYAGPVSHWWESSLLYCGPKIDWRYEGILCAYVQLYERTGNPVWLDRAIRAGDDVCQAQLPSGNYLNSSFQQGPIEGGTPHEAAVDVGLLELARLLQKEQDSRWQAYYRVAERNIQEYLIAQLWNGQAFLDQPWNSTLVPNKNATSLEALLLYEELSGHSLEQYILGAAKLILSAQVRQPGIREGATIHLGTKAHRLAIPIYTARCLSALVRLFQCRNDHTYLDAALRMGQFLLRSLSPGGVIFGFYANNRPIMAPIWISPVGDVLRAFLVLRPYTDIFEAAITTLQNILIYHQNSNGSIPTSYGLGYKGTTHLITMKPDFRDVLPVVGWCDKAFRALSMSLVNESNVEPSGNELSRITVPCKWKNRECLFQETSTHISLHLQNDKEIYSWHKSEYYPRIYQL